MNRTILFALLTLPFWLSSGCSKTSTQDSGPPQVVNLGTVELAYGVASSHDLGSNSVCILTAQPMDRSSIELGAVLEKKGKQVSSTRALPVRIGAPMEMSFGTVRVQLTPVIKQ